MWSKRHSVAHPRTRQAQRSPHRRCRTLVSLAGCPRRAGCLGPVACKARPIVTHIPGPSSPRPERAAADHTPQHPVEATMSRSSTGGEHGAVPSGDGVRVPGGFNQKTTHVTRFSHQDRRAHGSPVRTEEVHTPPRPASCSLHHCPRGWGMVGLAVVLRRRRCPGSGSFCRLRRCPRQPTRVCSVTSHVGERCRPLHSPDTAMTVVLDATRLRLPEGVEAAVSNRFFTASTSHTRQPIHSPRAKLSTVTIRSLLARVSSL